MSPVRIQALGALFSKNTEEYCALVFKYPSVETIVAGEVAENTSLPVPICLNSKLDPIGQVASVGSLGIVMATFVDAVNSVILEESEDEIVYEVAEDEGWYSKSSREEEFTFPFIEG